jgi:predicted RNA-binding Zn-ribbon protein involved in translation (DUF1610 family)
MPRRGCGKIRPVKALRKIRMLLKCPKCGKKISRDAMICPHCKCDIAASRPDDMERCRTCGTPLPVKEHRATVYKSDPTILDRSPVSAHTVHTPCPKCGDPRPLDRTNRSPLAGKRALVIGLLVVAIVAAGIYFLYLA